MDKISKRNENIKISLHNKSKDEISALKEEYAKFLCSMKKSDLGNSITRYEKELSFLSKLIILTKETDRKDDLEKYEKKVKEIEKIISEKKFKFQNNKENSIYFINPTQISFGSKELTNEEKIKILLKYKNKDENGNETPLLSNESMNKIVIADKQTFDKSIKLLDLHEKSQKKYPEKTIMDIILKKETLDNYIKIAETKNQNGEIIFDNFEAVNIFNSTKYNIENKEILDFLNKLTGVRSRNNKKIYSSNDIAQKMRLIAYKALNPEQVLLLNNFIHYDKEGNGKPIIATKTLGWDNIQRINWENIKIITEINNEKINENNDEIISKDIAEFFAFNKYSYLNENSKHFFSLLNEIQKNNEEQPFTNEDIKKYPEICRFKMTKEKLILISELKKEIEKNYSSQDAEYKIRNILEEGIIESIPEIPDEIFKTNLVVLSSIYQKNEEDVYYEKIIKQISNLKEKIDDNFAKKINELLGIKLNDKSFLEIEQCINIIKNEIPIEKIKELSNIKNKATTLFSRTEIEQFFFDSKIMNFLISNKEYIDDAIKMANIKSEGEKEPFLNIDTIFKTLLNPKYKENKEEYFSNLETIATKLDNYKTYWDGLVISNIATSKDKTKIFVERLDKNKDEIKTILQKLTAHTANDLIEKEELYSFILIEIPKILSSKDLSKLSIQEIFKIYNIAYLHKKENINELSLKEKKQTLKTIMAKNTDLFGCKNLKQHFPLIPTNKEEYCTLLPKLVNAIEIETKPISKAEREKFLNTDIFKLANEIKKVNFSNLKVDQEITTNEFIEKIIEAQKEHNISQKEMNKVFNYFAFEIKNKNLIGYPANIHNGKKLEEIENEKTKKFINETIRKIVIEYTQNNKIKTNSNEKLDRILNDIANVLPEIHTMIGKTQHKTHSYDVFVHSLKVLNEIVNDKEFEKITNEDKQVLILASLLHDITKEKDKIDKQHPKESSFDAYFICKKLNLPQNVEAKLYDLIRNHDWTEQINKATDKEKMMENYAFEFRFENLNKMAYMFAIADLKAVKENNQFYNYYKNDVEEMRDNISKLITKLQKTQIFLPNTTFPKANEIKDGKGVYRTEEGHPIININEIEDFETIGFPSGTTKENFKFLVHALSDKSQISNFDTFALIDSEALLSTSYLTNPFKEYSTFRPQGLILKCDTMDIHAGTNMGYGSGLKKNIDTLKSEYLFESGNRANDRTFFSKLMKIALGTTSEEKKVIKNELAYGPQSNVFKKYPQKLSDEQYIKLIQKYNNKSFDEIQNENPLFAEELVEIFDIIENCNKTRGRNYNEVLITRPEIQGVFMKYDSLENGIFETFVNTFRKDSDINNDLYNFARKNNLPIIVLGN